ncbi:myb-like protein X isoform X2 [Haplochromis burtoni]|uniref:myb-like protein X isoform X2 n=1 Tax=Haplochromis burtoni TaxID=8153 RepID=UPI001C2CFE81|nr:myb-like protein X isoform X2 [Haplochromis burtoni]
MGTQGTGRKRSTKKDKTTAEDDALNLIAREAEARLAAKRAARAEAREIRMKELERQQKEIFQVQKKYYGLNTKLDDRVDNKWGDIEQWMEDSERYSRPSRIHMLSDDDERMSVGSRGSARSDLDAVGAYGGGGSSHKKSKKKKKHKHKDRDRNGCDDEYSVISDRSSRLSDDSRLSRVSRSDLQLASYASSDLYSLNGLSSSRNPGSAFNGYQSSLYEDSLCSGSRRVISASCHPVEYTSYRSSGSRTSSRAGSARTSPVGNCSSVASFLRSSSSGLPRDLDDVTIPDFPDVEDRDYLEKGSRAASALTAATLTSLGGSSSRRGSGETALTVDAESSIREIKEIHELKDQIQEVEAKYTQNLKEVKDALAEVEEKYRKAMVSNAQLDNEKNNLMYQVDTLKDSLMELEELLTESRREHEEKVKEYEREKYAHSVLQFQFNEMKETLKQSEELLNEIRQLRLKQEGFVREITDLQETVEWKDKKIGALERQKEYTDAIRIERDELREEAVKLKDILKKHGIVLGPDLSINGDVDVAEADESSSVDPASQPAQESQTTPAEGNSMLGNTEETELRSSREEEEVGPEQQQEMHEKAKENHMSADLLCNAADVSTLKTSSEEQPQEEQETCLPAEKNNIAENGLSEDLNAEISDSPGTEPSSFELKEIVTSPDVPETEMSEEVNLKETSSLNVVETDAKSVSVDTSEVQDSKQEAVEKSSLTSTELCPQQKVADVAPKEDLTDESVPTASNIEAQPEPENAEEAENDEAEETPSKSQPQGTPASGKKKKKKKRGKKKGGAQDDKTKQKNETANEKKKDKEPAGSNDGSAAELTVDGSVTQTFKESKMDPVKEEQDKQETEEVNAVEPIESSKCKEQTVSNECHEEETLETNTVEEAEMVVPAQAICEAQKEVTVDHVKDEQNQGQTLETKATDTVEAEEPTQSLSHAEILVESETDSKIDDEDTKQTLETNKIEEMEEVSPSENPCQTETLSKVIVDDVTEEQNEEQTLEIETDRSVETEEPTESSSHLEAIKESIETDSKEGDQEEKPTLEVETLEEVESVTCIEDSETPSETIANHVTEEQNDEETLETETVESVEALKSVETLEESRTDSEKDEQDHKQTFETEKVPEMETAANPDTEANICTAELNSNSAEGTDGLDKECTSSVDDPERVSISTDGDAIHTDQTEEKVESADDRKSDSTSNNTENSHETSSNTEGESHVATNCDVAANDSESASERKDDTFILPPSADDSPIGSSDMEPSEVINSGTDDPPTDVTSEVPEESTDGEPRAETEQECPPAIVTSTRQDGDNSENKNLEEPKDLVNPDEKSNSCDGASSTESPEALSTETAVQDEELKVNAAVVLDTAEAPKEATQTGSSTDLESAVMEDPQHKNDQHEEVSCLSTEQPHESNKDQSENNNQLESEGEEDEEDEGQSFDFDDMDIEAAEESTRSQNPEQEEVDEGVELTADETNDGLCQSNAESNENKPAEGNDGGNQADKDPDMVPEEDQNSVAHEEATSEKVENVCEEEKNTHKEEASEEDQPGKASEEVSSAGALGAVAENINQTVSSSVEAGIDVVKNALQGEDADLPNSADQAGSNKGAAQSGKESKKSGKKGKGKGKEECKMS